MEAKAQQSIAELEDCKASLAQVQEELRGKDNHTQALEQRLQEGQRALDDTRAKLEQAHLDVRELVEGQDENFGEVQAELNSTRENITSLEAKLLEATTALQEEVSRKVKHEEALVTLREELKGAQDVLGQMRLELETERKRRLAAEQRRCRAENLCRGLKAAFKIKKLGMQTRPKQQKGLPMPDST